MENELLIEKIKHLEAENESLRKGIIKAYDDIHGWSWSEVINIVDVAINLKALLKGEENGI